MELTFDTHVLCEAMHVTDDWLKTRAGVHRSTVARWRATRKYPPAVARLAEIEAYGRLELIHAHWQGWRIDVKNGELISPGGERYRSTELLALPIRFQLLTELGKPRGLLDRLKARIRRALLLKAE